MVDRLSLCALFSKLRLRGADEVVEAFGHASTLERKC